MENYNDTIEIANIIDEERKRVNSRKTILKIKRNLNKNIVFEDKEKKSFKIKKYEKKKFVQIRKRKVKSLEFKKSDKFFKNNY